MTIVEAAAGTNAVAVAPGMEAATSVMPGTKAEGVSEVVGTDQVVEPEAQAAMI
jgi:hypothetical protein